MKVLTTQSPSAVKGELNDVIKLQSGDVFINCIDIILYIIVQWIMWTRTKLLKVIVQSVDTIDGKMMLVVYILPYCLLKLQ